MINLAGRVALLTAIGTCVAGCGAASRVAHTSSSPASSASHASPSPTPSPSAAAAPPSSAAAPATSPVPSTVPASPTPKSVPGLAGYLVTSASSVTFIQMQEDAGGDIGGTSYSAVVSGTAPSERVLVTPSTFTGQIVDNAITFNILGHTDYGTMSHATMTLNVLQPTGTIQPIVYTQATPSDYNAALANLTATAGAANAAESQRQADAQAAASASAAAASASAAAVDATDTPVCNEVGGQFSGGFNGLQCGRIPYLGSDHSTYYSSVAMTTTGAFLGPMDTAGTGATQQECTTGYYPDLSTGPGHAPPGHWNDPLQVCLP